MTLARRSLPAGALAATEEFPSCTLSRYSAARVLAGLGVEVVVRIFDSGRAPGLRMPVTTNPAAFALPATLSS